MGWTLCRLVVIHGVAAAAAAAVRWLQLVLLAGVGEAVVWSAAAVAAGADLTSRTLVAVLRVPCQSVLVR